MNSKYILNQYSMVIQYVFGQKLKINDGLV